MIYLKKKRLMTIFRLPFELPPFDHDISGFQIGVQRSQRSAITAGVCRCCKDALKISIIRLTI